MFPLRFAIFYNLLAVQKFYGKWHPNKHCKPYKKY